MTAVIIILWAGIIGIIVAWVYSIKMVFGRFKFFSQESKGVLCVK